MLLTSREHHRWPSHYTGPKDEFEESFRLVKGGPDELAQLPADVVQGLTYVCATDSMRWSGWTGLMLLRRCFLGLVVESASIDDIV